MNAHSMHSSQNALLQITCLKTHFPTSLRCFRAAIADLSIRCLSDEFSEGYVGGM